MRREFTPRRGEYGHIIVRKTYNVSNELISEVDIVWGITDEKQADRIAVRMQEAYAQGREDERTHPAPRIVHVAWTAEEILNREG